MSIQILLKAFSPENYDHSLPFVILDVTPDMLKRWIQQINQVAALKAEDKTIYKIEYDDRGPEWAWGTALEKYAGEKYAEAERQVERHDWYIPEIPIFGDDFDPSQHLERDDYLRVECIYINVTERELFWSCFERHTDWKLTTGQLSIGTIANLLADIEDKTDPPKACKCTPETTKAGHVCRWCWVHGRKAWWHSPVKQEEKK